MWVQSSSICVGIHCTYHVYSCVYWGGCMLGATHPNNICDIVHAMYICTCHIGLFVQCLLHVCTVHVYNTYSIVCAVLIALCMCTIMVLCSICCTVQCLLHCAYIWHYLCSICCTVYVFCCTVHVYIWHCLCSVCCTVHAYMHMYAIACAVSVALCACTSLSMSRPWHAMCWDNSIPGMGILYQLFWSYCCSSFSIPWLAYSMCEGPFMRDCSYFFCRLMPIQQADRQVLHTQRNTV